MTLYRPKPLLPFLNRPLVEWILAYLGRFRVDRVVLNTHHLAGAFEHWLAQADRTAFQEVVLIHEPQLLNTGGGLVGARDFFRSDPFLVISGDILTDIDLEPAIEFHRRHSGPVTLLLHDHPGYNRIEVDDRGRIRRFRLKEDRGLDFANIHILDRAVFRFLPSSGAFDIILAYQNLIDRGVPVHAYLSHDHYWRNIGTPEGYRKTHEEWLTGKGPAGATRFLDPLRQPKGAFIDPSALLEDGVRIEGWACIGKDCRLRAGSVIRRSILWEAAEIGEKVTVSDAIIGKGVKVTGHVAEGILL